MKKILVAIDGSEVSTHAARTARALATALGAELVLAYVVPPYVNATDALGPVEELEKAEQSRGRATLENAVNAIGGGATTVVLAGPVAEALSDHAEEEGFDLIVVGSTGKGAVKRLLMGSVSTRLTHIAKKSVLVVR